MQIYLHILVMFLLGAALVTISVGFLDWLTSRKRIKQLKELGKWDGRERRKYRGLDKTNL